MIVIRFIEILLIILTILNFFKMFISLFGFKEPKREYPLVDDEKTFLFLIPACNEEAVIKSTLLSLKSVDYDKKLFDVVTLVNNSTDNTFAISKSVNPNTLDIKFTENDPKGKPHVLKKFFTQQEYWKNYDYIIILDADNIVSKNYLKEINSQLVDREKKGENITVVQGYLGSKNIFTSWMSAGYAASYFISNRGYQYAKHVLKMNTTIGGTGFALKTDYLKNHGWQPKSYTEDFELQIELSVLNERSIWNHFAVVYDEKPIDFFSSHRQRIRWAKGHWYVALTTTFKQIKSLFDFKSLNRLHSKIEALSYSYSMLRPVVWILIILTALFIPIPEEFIPEIFGVILFWIVLNIYDYLVMPTFMLKKEAEYLFDDENLSSFTKIKRWLKLFFAGYYSGITYMIQQAIGFFTCFRPQNNWPKTKHVFDLNHDDPSTEKIKDLIIKKENEMDDL